jgi:hypothetical protein
MRDSIEVFVNVDLIEIPDDIVNVLEAICDPDPDYPYPDPKWRELFDSFSGPFPSSRVGLLWLTGRTRYTLLGKGSYSDSEQSVRAFFAWLDPWIAADSGEFIGYLRREEENAPELFFKR